MIILTTSSDLSAMPNRHLLVPIQLRHLILNRETRHQP